MAAHQAPPSLGFSRQEHWSGLPFPSPMRESEVLQSCPTPSDPMNCSLPCTPPSMGFSRQEYWSGLPFPSPGNLPGPGIEPRSPALQADFCIASGLFTGWAAKEALKCKLLGISVKVVCAIDFPLWNLLRFSLNDVFSPVLTFLFFPLYFLIGQLPERICLRQDLQNI